MNTPLILTSPVFVILLRWTSLLALGWAAHALLSRRHPGWRLILWRSLLCFGLVLPLAGLLDLPGIKIPIDGDTRDAIQSVEPTTATPSAGTTSAAAPSPAVSQPTQAGAQASPSPSRPAMDATRPHSIWLSWDRALLLVWLLGCVAGGLRLFRATAQLARLRRETLPPPPFVSGRSEAIRSRLGMRRPVVVRVSDAVSSPFVCGVINPMILLPRGWVGGLSHEEMAGLLGHEIAHLRRNDLAWCIAWRWMTVVWWFHPLVWGVSGAHTLACEEEADRIAADESGDQESYARLLARLALRVLGLPVPETRLSLNATSQIAQRLTRLARGAPDRWNTRYSAAAFALVAALFAVTAGFEFSTARAASSRNASKVDFAEVLVVVQDDSGKPIEGASVLPDGFRVKGQHKADAYHWGPTMFGGPIRAITDREGIARVKYPVMGIPEEKELTGALIFSVSHPEYCTVRLQDYAVDAPGAPVRLTPGIHLEVSAWYGSPSQRVTELVPNLSQEGLHKQDWQHRPDGTLSFHKLSPGRHLLQLMGRLSSGEIVFSEGIPLSAEKGKECRAAVEMRPGIRLEGRLDARVPRPVSDGRVVVSVRPKELPASLIIEDYAKAFEDYGYFHVWKSHRRISEDGRFLFESLPPGELDVVVLGEGFVSRSIGKLQNRVKAKEGSDETKVIDGPRFGIPQTFQLTAPMTRIEVLTEPTATVELTARTTAGSPVAGATVQVNPNVVRMQTGLFAYARSSSELPFNAPGDLGDPFSTTTGPDGVAVLRNVPPQGLVLDVTHQRYQVSFQDPGGWRDRSVRLKLSPGVTNRLTLALEPTGSTFIGTTGQK